MRDFLITDSDTYCDLPINDNHGGCHTEILERIYQFLYLLTQFLSRVFVFRFDIRYPQNYLIPDCNKQQNMVEELLRQLAQHWRRKNQVFEYIWVREEEVPGRPHYHVAAFVNGKMNYSAHQFITKAADIWARLLGDDTTHLVRLCYRHHVEDERGTFRRPTEGAMLDLNDEMFSVIWERVFYWLSYLAKRETKELNPEGVRTWNSSRPWLGRQLKTS